MCNTEIEERNKEVVRRYWEGKWNERRPEILDEIQKSDVKYHSASMQMNNIDEYRAAYTHYLSAFQETHIAIEDMIAEGDKVMTRTVLNGTHKGELAGIPPTGKTLSARVFTVFRLEDGKIAEEWEIIDELGMMTQLGMELRMKEE